MQKSILITGCSSGIGLSAACTLHDKGYRVFATARKASDVANLKKLGLESLLLDINDSESIRAAVKEVLQRTQGKLDALFNNCGIVVPGAVEDISRDILRAQFETNLFGPMELTNLIIPVMRKQGYGRIINNTSILGIIAMPYRGAYNASKFALEGLSNTLRQELRKVNIFVSNIAPGPINSNLRENALAIYQHTLQNKVTANQRIYQQMETHFFHPTKGKRQLSLPPDAVVKKLIHALESKHPKAHYYIGFPAHLFAILRRVLPDSWLDWLLAKVANEEIDS
jgi:NAD(P)-dependent dehydrogenase (short-subunit alcohol dehydrogenase family)